MRSYSPFSPPWHELAACNGPEARRAARQLGLEDTVDLFFPSKEKAKDAYALARPICRTLCPVRAECAAAIAAHPVRLGMWAGTTPEERHPRTGKTPQTETEQKSA